MARFVKKGLGAVLIAEALIRVASIAEQLGVAGLFVDAKDESAAAFYRKHGFAPLVSNPKKSPKGDDGRG